MTPGCPRPATRRRVAASLSAALALGATLVGPSPASASALAAPVAAPVAAPAAAMAGPAAGAPAPAAGAPAAALGAAHAGSPLAAAGAGSPLGAARAPVVACPRPDVQPPPGRPPRPTPPEDDPVLRAVGGDALATDGLVIPPGAKKPPALTATSWLVADLDTGEVLGGCGPHVYGTPASVQKLLLAATVMDKLDPKKTITITDGDLDIEPGSSAVGLLPRGKYTIATLWLGLLLNSGNEAANALARLGGARAVCRRPWRP